jgi:serine/threonine-protein kinase
MFTTDRPDSEDSEEDVGPRRAPLFAGRLVGGKYELVRTLGRGSMGEVWAAHHRALGEDVAVKFLSPAPELGSIEAPDAGALRFRREAQIAARLSRRSPHIVRVTDYGEDDGAPYLVMELLEGRTLDRALLLRGNMAPREAARLVKQIARGLEHAHARGVVHRDLKPANVFLVQDEDGQTSVKLLDFGVARVLAPAASVLSTARGILLGTPGYMSAEHVLSSAMADASCDLWALATIAYEMLTCELPVVGLHAEDLIASARARRVVPLGERCRELSSARSLEAFFSRAFAERVEDRFATASELAQAFEEAVDRLDRRLAAPLGLGSLKKPASLATRPRWPWWGGTLLASAAGLATLTLVGAASGRAAGVLPGERARIVAPKIAPILAREAGASDEEVSRIDREPRALLLSPRQLPRALPGAAGATGRFGASLASAR